MSLMQMVANITGRRLDVMFPGFFQGYKHNHYRDFGYPETLAFQSFYDMYTRNGLARAGIEKTTLKTWQDFPYLREKEEADDETSLEGEIRQRFSDLRLWQRLVEADRRSLVGAYGGAILRLADSKPFREPVDSVPGGLDGLVEIIPAWEGQLEVSEWDMDETSPDYGKPKMFRFNEAQVGTLKTQPRAFELHPDRVVVWSRDGTVHCRSFLEPGYNDLMTLEKISGAGGEGFWKNAKSAPVLEADPAVNLGAMAKGMGVPESELADAMDAQVADWQKGFDQLLFLQGIKASTLQVTLPSPEHFYAVALQSFAASIGMPSKILVGMQTGERASTEDAREWAQTNMARRHTSVIPNVMEVINRLERFGIIPQRDWFLDWPDLTESSADEKIDRAYKMADTNAKMQSSGEVIFTGDEIRAAVDLEPLSDADRFLDEDEDDVEAAMTPPEKDNNR